MKTLDIDLKNQTYKRCYLLFGEEDYLKQSYKKAFINAIVPDDTMNYNYYRDKETDVNELIGICDTLPFFSDYRLVVVENSGFFKNSNDALSEYIDKIPDSTILVFVEKDIDKRNKLYKKVNKMGYACELNLQGQEQLSRWLMRFVARDHKKITRSAMQLFMDTVGDDMMTMKQEMEKLLSYTIDKESITDSDVLEVCTKRVEVKIFALFDEIAAGNQSGALRIYYELVENKEPLMRILFMLSKQFKQILFVKEMSDRGTSNGEIVKTLGLRSDWVVKQLIRQGKRFSKARLREAYEECAANEQAVKTGTLDEKIAVEMILIKYS